MSDRQYVIGHYLEDGTIEADEHSAPHREWELERLKDINAEWKGRRVYQLFELVPVSDGSKEAQAIFEATEWATDHAKALDIYTPEVESILEAIDDYARNCFTDGEAGK